MAESINRREYLANTFRYGQCDGEMSVGIVVHLRESKALWGDREFVEQIRDEYKLGYYCGVSTKLAASGEIPKQYACQTRSRAIAVCVTKTPYNPESKDVDSKRDLIEENIMKCCHHAWSHQCYLAGMPNQKTGKPRSDKKGKQAAREKAARAAAKAAETKPASPTPINFSAAALALPKFESRPEVYAQAISLAAAMRTIENKCGDHKLGIMGDLLPVFEEFIGKVKLICQSGVKGSAVKPANGTHETKPIPPASQPSETAIAKQLAIAASK